jgi:hypothetical protein
MKRLWLVSLVFVLLSGFAVKNEIKAQSPESNYFFTALEPYGPWIEVGNNLYAWQPNGVGYNWAPYKDGRWTWSSYGWYWDSYEPFGDITYHYGRWYRDDYYGWLWMPDNEWGPAWVEWRYDNDYVGWAPLSPYATFSITAGLRFSVQYESPYTNWMFVRYHNFCEPRLNSYYIPASYRSRIFRNTTYRADYAYRDNRVINRGVDVNIIESRGRVTVKERNITIVNNPRGDVRGGQRDRIEVFAPKREDMRRADISNVKIIRSDRQTNLEVNKVNVGRREDLGKNVVRENSIRTDQNNNGNTGTRNNVARPAPTRANDNQIRTNRQSAVPNRNSNTPNVQRNDVNTPNAQRQNANRQNTPSVQRRDANRQNVQPANKPAERKTETIEKKTDDKKEERPNRRD